MLLFSQLVDEEIQSQNAVDPNALHARLQSLSSAPKVPTPPPSRSRTQSIDYEAEEAFERGLEEDAYNSLVEAGCPPCYSIGSSSLGELSERTREREKQILQHWHEHQTTFGKELYAQWKNWQNFCRFQVEIRESFARKGYKFPDFSKRVRERRQRHNLPEAVVELLEDFKAQSPFQNWVEFQNYHLHKYEQFEREKKRQAENYANALEKQKTCAGGHDADIAGLNIEAAQILGQRATDNMAAYSKNLLPWIEAVRLDKLADEVRHGENRTDVENMGSPKVKSRKVKSETRRSSLGPVRSAVTKKEPKRRSPRISENMKKDAVDSSSMADGNLQKLHDDKLRVPTMVQNSATETIKPNQISAIATPPPSSTPSPSPKTRPVTPSRNLHKRTVSPTKTNNNVKTASPDSPATQQISRRKRKQQFRRKANSQENNATKAHTAGDVSEASFVTRSGRVSRKARTDWPGVS